MLIAALLLVLFSSLVNSAFAEPLVSLEPATDGTLLLVGKGWRPGQKLVVSAGRDLFPATADGAGDFEVATGLPAAVGPGTRLSVKRQDPSLMAMAQLIVPPLTQAPNPLAVLFAQSLATGAELLALSGVALGLLRVGIRRLRA